MIPTGFFFTSPKNFEQKFSNFVIPVVGGTSEGGDGDGNSGDKAGSEDRGDGDDGGDEGDTGDSSDEGDDGGNFDDQGDAQKTGMQLDSDVSPENEQGPANLVLNEICDDSADSDCVKITRQIPGDTGGAVVPPGSKDTGAVGKPRLPGGIGDVLAHGSDITFANLTFLM